MYARIYWSLAQNLTGFDGLFSQSRVSWSRMKKGFESLVAKYPDSWNLNNYAVASCYAGDMKTLAALLDRVGSNVYIAAWPSPTVFDRCKARANAAATSPGAPVPSVSPRVPKLPGA